jgi:hypothetical protein
VKSEYHVWVNALRDYLGLDPIPFTLDASEPIEFFPLPEGGSDFSSGEECVEFPAAQRQMFLRQGIRNLIKR